MDDNTQFKAYLQASTGLVRELGYETWRGVSTSPRGTDSRAVQFILNLALSRLEKVSKIVGREKSLSEEQILRMSLGILPGCRWLLDTVSSVIVGDAAGDTIKSRQMNVMFDGSKACVELLDAAIDYADRQLTNKGK